MDPSKTLQSVFKQNPALNAVAATSNKRFRPDEIIAEKRSYWAPAEDAEIIRLKASGMKWEDISKRLRGRSALSCRLHYRKYLERQGEKTRNKLVQVYNRDKSEIWNTITAVDAEPREPGWVGQRRTTLHSQASEGHDLTLPSSNYEDSYRPRSAYSQQHLFPKASDETFNHQRASPSTKPGHYPYSCFRCEKPRPIGTCDGWKKHMKEHETVFPCRQCEGSDTAGKSWSYTRKANLVKHLCGTHNISDSDASTRAEMWCKTVKRKYFSCGFCVSLFYNIADQLNHIDTEHFRRHQDISRWDISTAIKGLIQQPGVNLLWQRCFGRGYPRSQDFTWNDSVAKNLQLQLELGEKSAEDLTIAAISQVIWTEIPQDSDEASLTGGFTNPHMDQNMLSVQGRAIVTPIRSPCPHGHGPGAPGHLAFTPVNIPPINSPLYTQKNIACDNKGRKEEDKKLPGFAEFIKGVEDLKRRGK